MNKKFLLSMVVNLVLIGGIGGLLFEKQQSNQRLNATILHDTIYRAKHGDDSWNTQRPEGYYLFADEEYITVKTFGQKQLMKAKYQVIGNGVYELEQHQGFVLVKEDHLQLKLSEKNPLIFEEYLIFAKF